MPKKTLREKLLANKRREKLFINFALPKTYNQNINPSRPKVTVNNTAVLIQNSTYTSLNIPSRLTNTTNYSHIINDLKRIFLISAVAFCLEGLLYLLVVKHFRIF